MENNIQKDSKPLIDEEELEEYRGWPEDNTASPDNIQGAQAAFDSSRNP